MGSDSSGMADRHRVDSGSADTFYRHADRSLNMSLIDILLIGAITAAVAAALVSIKKQRKSGKGCCGDCSACHAACKDEKSRP